MISRRVAILAGPLAAIIIFLPTLTHDFVFDDRGVIVENPLMQDISDLPRLLLSPYWHLRGHEHTLYRPLTSLSFALDRALAGEMNPGWFHLVNALLHGAATFLVALLAWKIFASALPVAMCGLLFALHPVHVEAVAGIVGRADVLAACGILVAIMMHRRAQRLAGARGGGIAMAAAWGAALAAFLSKESGITAPFLCALADLAFGSDGPAAKPRRRLLFAGHAVVLATGFALRYVVLGTHGIGKPIPMVDNPAASAGALDGRLTALGTVVRYAGLLLWPSRLSVDYSFDQIPVIHTVWDPLALGGMAIVALVVIGGFAILSRLPACGFALLFIAIAAAPTANVLFFVGTLLAERLMYIPSIGLCLLLAWGLSRAPGPTLRRAAMGASLLILALAAARTWTRLPDWRDDFALYRSAAQVSPRCARIRYNLGNAHLRLERFREAEENYRAALGIYPRFVSAQVNLGMVLLNQGRPQEALDLLLSAQMRAPDREDLAVNLGMAHKALGDLAAAEAEFRRALSLDPESARAWNNLGSIYLARDDPHSAVKYLQKAVRADPDLAIFRVNLADALVAAGRESEAVMEFEVAAQLDPDLPDARRGMGEVALLRGDLVAAEREFRSALEDDPMQARAANFLGYLLSLRGDHRGAIEQYERALAIDPTLHDAHRSLGLIFAHHVVDPKRAIKHLEASLRIDPDQPQAEDLKRLLRDLAR